MAEPTSVALAAASIPILRRHRSRGEVRARALPARRRGSRGRARPGTPRRRALDQALAELEEKAKIPSTAWRREFSLLLGLERVLSEDEPKLADGTVLSAHQVDALSGTLTALLAEALRSTENGGNAAAAASPELLASAAIFGPDEAAPAGGSRRRQASGAGAAETAWRTRTMTTSRGRGRRGRRRGRRRPRPRPARRARRGRRGRRRAR